MTVRWIAIQSQPLPWEETRNDVALLVCGEDVGQLQLVCLPGSPNPPGMEDLLNSLEKAVTIEKNRSAPPNLTWLRKAMPDQGTSIRLSPIRQEETQSFEETVRRLSEPPSNIETRSQ